MIRPILKFFICSCLFFLVIVTSGMAQKDNATSKKKVGSSFVQSLKWWDYDISKKPYSWFETEDANTMATNIISWQDNDTGWPLMNTVREPYTGDLSKAGPWGKKAALVKATLNELRFLARAYTVTEEEDLKVSALGGLDYILDAQLDCGGWPHSYPYKTTGYGYFATFNDDVITDIMKFLGESMRSPDFKWLSEEKMKKIKSAYRDGLEFILKAQIKVDGILSAWAQQYDPQTLEPRSARSFEPAAISGGESAGVLLFLMDIPGPSQPVIEAVEAGVRWYQEVQIDSLELIRTADDRKVKMNPDAPPLWARYYEIGTNRPIFAGRDSIIHYQLAEVEKERRGGYAWYNYNGIDVINRYEKWKYERKWDNLPETNTSESKVGDYVLPEILKLKNGEYVSSVKNWESQRRPEIMDLFEVNQHGRTPEFPISIKNEVIESNEIGMNGKSKRTQVRITFPDHPEVTPIRILLNSPATSTGPVPTLLHLSFTPSVLLFDEPGIEEGIAWDRRREVPIPDKEARLLKDIDPYHFIDHGYAIATVYYGDIEPDFDHSGSLGVRSLFNENKDQDQASWGSLGAWSWGLSRVIDYLRTDPNVDADKIAVSGVSRLGKAILWTAAQDERIAMAIPIVSGEGGAAISRRRYGETVADLTKPSRYDYWFSPRYADYAFNVSELPVDAHMLLSLIAPRPLLLITGSTDTWSDPVGEWVAAKAASEIYELYSLEGVGEFNTPEAGDKILRDMGFFMHDGGHTVLPQDFETMTDFMDMHFREN